MPQTHDEHHGCPFKHMKSNNLIIFLNKRYGIPVENLKHVIYTANSEHYQIAC